MLSVLLVIQPGCKEFQFVQATAIRHSAQRWSSVRASAFWRLCWWLICIKLLQIAQDLQRQVWSGYDVQVSGQLILTRTVMTPILFSNSRLSTTHGFGIQLSNLPFLLRSRSVSRYLADTTTLEEYIIVFQMEGLNINPSTRWGTKGTHVGMLCNLLRRPLTRCSSLRSPALLWNQRRHRATEKPRWSDNFRKRYNSRQTNTRMVLQNIGCAPRGRSFCDHYQC